MSSCVFLTCAICKTSYCARGCSHSCSCGQQAERTPEEEVAYRARIKKQEEELAASFPDGWF